MTRTTDRLGSDHEPSATWAPVGALTIETVATHWEELQARLAPGRPLIVDLAAVERVDTAGVQLLLQARRVAAGVGLSLQVQGLTMAPDSRQLLGIPEDAALSAHVTPATMTGQEG